MRRDDAIQALESSIEKIQRFLAGRSFADFSRDAIVYDAVVFNLETVSDACRHLGADRRAQSPDTPWQHLADLGDVLQHEYYAINDAALWDTIKTDLPALATAVRRLRGQTKPSLPL